MCCVSQNIHTKKEKKHRKGLKATRRNKTSNKKNKDIQEKKNKYQNKRALVLRSICLNGGSCRKDRRSMWNTA